MAEKQLLIAAESLLNLMMAHATGGSASNLDYAQLRARLLDARLEDHLPKDVLTCRSLDQFWGVIKRRFGTYQERRDYLYQEFQPLLDRLESTTRSPADQLITMAVRKVDGAFVHQAWNKALERRNVDPEGAITMARTLLEAVCKLILDDADTAYGDSPDINKLYGLAAEQLNLAPSQHSEKDFKRILGGCSSVIEGLGGLRNRLGDSHGKGASWVKPAPRHAELAVNLAGAMATFLLTTWEFKSGKTLG